MIGFRSSTLFSAQVYIAYIFLDLVILTTISRLKYMMKRHGTPCNDLDSQSISCCKYRCNQD